MKVFDLYTASTIPANVKSEAGNLMRLFIEHDRDTLAVDGGLASRCRAARTARLKAASVVA